MNKQDYLDAGFLFDAYKNANKSSCIKRKVGAVLAIGDVSIADGYNGTPRGIKNCNEGGCPRCNDPTIPSGKDLDKCLCIHAERNAIHKMSGKLFVLGYSYSDNKINGATLYVTNSPCLYCAKDIVLAGIPRVVYDEAYSNAQDVTDFLKEGNVECIQQKLDVGLKGKLFDVLKEFNEKYNWRKK